MSFAFTRLEDEGTIDSVSARLLATAANILGIAGDPTEEEVASAIKGRLRRGKCHSDKQALQIFLGRLQLDDAGVVEHKGTKLHVPAAELWKELVLDEHGTSHLLSRQTWHGGTCKCGVGSVVHRHKYRGMIEVTVTRLSCALVFPSVGQDLRNNQTKAGYTGGFRRAYMYHPFILLS